MKSSTVAKALAATALVLPALVNGLLHFVDPLTGDDAEEELRQAVAHPTLTDLDNLKLLLLLLLPAVVLVGLVTFRRAPWATLLGVTLVSVSFIANTLDLAEYQIFSVASRHQDVFVPALKVTEDSGISSALSMVFILGSLVGMVLLGVALLRSGAVPGWAAWAVIASGPLNIVGHLGTPRIVDVLAWLLLAAGLGAVAPRVFDVIDRASGAHPTPEPAGTTPAGTLASGRP
jgi:hypothetical protein